MGTKTIDIINTTMEEHELLIKAGSDIREFGITDKKCPRCENDIIIDIIGVSGTSYKIKCATPDCISATFRGI